MYTSNAFRPAVAASQWGRLAALTLCTFALLGVARVQAQPGNEFDTEVGKQKADQLIAEVLQPETIMKIDPRHSKLIRTKRPISRFSVTNPEIVEIVQFSPTEFELIGGAAGQTTLTLWFGDPAGDRTILRYLVQVGIDQAVDDRRRLEYGDLQDKINEFFPNSSIQLIPLADKLVIRGQARDAEEAGQILGIISNQSTDQYGRQLLQGAFGPIGAGTAVQPYPGVSDLPTSSIINLMEVPGDMQIMLKVRIAELTRSAQRDVGTNLSFTAGDFRFNSPLGVAGTFSAVLNSTDVDLAFSASSTNSYAKILAEPNLVTLSGRSATFNAGGEFAVPTVVGVEGVGAATTAFRGFGTQLSFTPVVIDKDRFRLTVSPSFSTLNGSNSVNGIPGLDSRSVNTTVDLREGQWLAIAGLIQDQQGGSKARVPFLGDIPVIDTLFSRRTIKREESELLILVSPELVHPLEPEEVPLCLPGMEVTEPPDLKFYFGGYYEGDPRCEHRSTVWPIYQQNMTQARTTALREAKQQSGYQRSEKYYVNGCHGFSE